MAMAAWLIRRTAAARIKIFNRYFTGDLLVFILDLQDSAFYTFANHKQI